jgi:hypothetical protein
MTNILPSAPKLPSRDYFVRALDRCLGNSVAVESQAGGTIQAAHFAFGGHISSGLLKRGRTALNKRHGANEKVGRKRIFLAIFDLPNLLHFRGVTRATWDDVNRIIDQCHLYKDFGDSYDFHSASREFACYPRIEALRAFVRRYGNSHEQKLVAARLEKPAELVAIDAQIAAERVLAEANCA